MDRAGKATLHSGQGLLGLDDLRLLAALAEGGTLSAAAKLLRVNHASAWRRLGMLEGRLGVRLFERERAGYVPTPAGEAAVQSAQRVLGELAELERLLVGQDVRPRGVVRLTTTDTLSDLITPILAELRSTHPGIVVELITSNVFFTLTRRDADIALRPAVSAAYVHETDRHFHQSGHLRFNHSRHFARATAGPAPRGGGRPLRLAGGSFWGVFLP